MANCATIVASMVPTIPKRDVFAQKTQYLYIFSVAFHWVKPNTEQVVVFEEVFLFFTFLCVIGRLKQHVDDATYRNERSSFSISQIS